jgi:thiosulfate dehydrogenase [quinone] large subunit
MLYRAAPVSEPGLARWLFGDPRSAWLWLALRLYIGWEWFNAGREKLWPASGPSWLSNGDGLKGYWARAVAVPTDGHPPIVYGWYRDFLQFMLDHHWYTWFSGLVAAGELLVGVALVLGAFVGIAAFFGALMNFNYMLAGTASTNPVLLILAIFLIVAWRVAGTIGADRWLLPKVLTPWQWLAQRHATAGLRHRRVYGHS